MLSPLIIGTRPGPDFENQIPMFYFKKTGTGTRVRFGLEREREREALGMANTDRNVESLCISILSPTRVVVVHSLLPLCKEALAIWLAAK